VDGDADDATAAQGASLLFETALLESGYALDDPQVGVGWGRLGLVGDQ
jgi:hypothetical protein